MAIKIKDENDTFDMKKVTSIVDRIKRNIKQKGRLLRNLLNMVNLRG